MQMPLKEVQGPKYYYQDGQIQGGGVDLLNWKHHTPSFTEKPQALIDLVQSIIQTHKPTWADCQQLLLTLVNTKEQCHIILVALKWLEGHAPVGILNAQAYTQAQFSEEDPHWTLMITKVSSSLNNIRRHEGRREKGHEHEQNTRSPPRTR
jgi:hypothetical protein